MNAQDIRNLQEAYMNVYRELDEVIGDEYWGTRAANYDWRQGRRSSRSERLGLNKEEYEYLMNYILSERYAETAEAAEVIMVNMSEEWISTILEEHPVDTERLLMQNFKRTGIPYRQRQYLKSKPRKISIGG